MKKTKRRRSWGGIIKTKCTNPQCDNSDRVTQKISNDHTEIRCMLCKQALEVVIE